MNRVFNFTRLFIFGKCSKSADPLFLCATFASVIGIVWFCSSWKPGAYGINDYIYININICRYISERSLCTSLIEKPIQHTKDNIISKCNSSFSIWSNISEWPQGGAVWKLEGRDNDPLLSPHYKPTEDDSLHEHYRESGWLRENIMLTKSSGYGKSNDAGLRSQWSSSHSINRMPSSSYKWAVLNREV